MQMFIVKFEPQKKRLNIEKKLIHNTFLPFNGISMAECPEP